MIHFSIGIKSKIKQWNSLQMAATFGTANVYGEVREEIDLPYIKKTGDTATGLIIFDGGIETNIGTATFNGPIIATDQVTIQPSGSLFVDGPSEFADDVTITGGTLQVDVPATFNNSVIYNDSLTFNDLITCTNAVQLTSTSSLTVAGTSSWDPGSTLNVGCTPEFTVGALFTGGGATTTVQSTGMVVQDPTVNRLSNFLATSLSINDTTPASTILASLNTQTLTLQNDVNNSIVIDNNIGGPSINILQNDGGATNRQANLNTTSVSCYNLAISPVSGFYGQANGTIASFSTNTGVLAPQLLLQNINTASGAGNGVNMQTFKQKGGGSGATGDEVFRLSMFAENANNDKEEYGRITCNIRDASAPSAGADGQILLAVPVGDAMSTFIDINGNSNRTNLLKDVAWANGSIQNTAYTGFTGSPTTFTNPSITFDTQGKITAVTNGATVGALTALPIATPVTVASGDGINIVTGSILGSGVYLIFGVVNFVVSSGASYFNFCNVTYQKNAVDFFQSNTAGNAIFTLGVNLPIMPYSSNGSDVLTIYSNGCQVNNSSNYTISNSNSLTRIYAMKIAN